MLFHCPQCHTEYDFDDSQIPPEGVAVQCANCPQIFEVRPQPKTANAPDEWEIRRANGTNYKFKELTTLQKWIIEQKVTREDMISHSGSSWKALGEIPELASFFKVVENQHRNIANPVPGQFDYPQVPQQPNYGNVPTYPPVANSGYFMPPIAANMGEFSPPGGLVDYSPFPKAKSHPLLKAFGVITLAVLAGGGIFYFLAPQSFNDAIVMPVRKVLGIAGINPEAQAAFNQAQERIYLWDKTSLDEADQLLFQATRLQKNYVAAIALTSQVRLMQADMKMEEYYWLEKSGQNAEQQTKLRLTANHLSEEGFNLAKRALESSPNNRVALRVMIDYYRHKKAITQAEPLIAQAKNFPNNYLDITLGMAYLENDSTAEEGLKLLDNALANFEVYNHPRYFIAKYYYEHEKPEEALKVIAKILESAPNHELALQMKAEIEKPKPAPVQAKAAAPAPAPMTPERLLRRANQLRTNERPQEALTIYNKLLESNSKNIQALLGQGWCYVDLGYAPSAIDSFQQVININIRNGEAYYGLAEAYRLQLNKKEAIKNYTIFLEISPDHPDAAFARKSMENLKK